MRIKYKISSLENQPVALPIRMRFIAESIQEDNILDGFNPHLHRGVRRRFFDRSGRLSSTFEILISTEEDFLHWQARQIPGYPLSIEMLLREAHNSQIEEEQRQERIFWGR